MKILSLALGLMILAACDEMATAATEPAELGRLAAAVETASAEDAEKLLVANGHSEESFQEAVTEVMEDEEKVVQFSQAYEAEK